MSPTHLFPQSHNTHSHTGRIRVLSFRSKAMQATIRTSLLRCPPILQSLQLRQNNPAFLFLPSLNDPLPTTEERYRPWREPPKTLQRILASHRRSLPLLPRPVVWTSGHPPSPSPPLKTSTPIPITAASLNSHPPPSSRLFCAQL